VVLNWVVVVVEREKVLEKRGSLPLKRRQKEILSKRMLENTATFGFEFFFVKSRCQCSQSLGEVICLK
jgi:hypothetical protein